MFLPTERWQLIEGDAAAVLRDRVADRSIDMVYCDPPFGNEQDWKGRAGAFSDKWGGDKNETAWRAFVRCAPAAAELVDACCFGTGAARKRAYLGTIGTIMVQIRRILKLTGTAWLHFDDTMGALLRVLCCAIFGPALEIGTLIWKRTQGGHNNNKSFGRVHDTIACYGRSKASRWRLWRIGTIEGDPCAADWQPRFDDFAAAEPMNSFDTERLGYPTQKPVALLNELIRAATLKGDIVLDPTCGSGTTLAAAMASDRRAIGIDQSSKAIEVARKRLITAPPTQSELF